MFNAISHLTGIVPIAGQRRVDYVFPWHDCLMPLDKDYYAIQRSVYECALAGCNVIWIVSDLEFQPLIKEIVGEWIMDPISIDRDKIKEEFDHRRIPIYYMPIHPKDIERRDCLGWSILYGANVANKISRKISKWAVSDRFWVSFPQGIYDPSEIEKFRRGKGQRSPINYPNNNFCLTYEGKNVTNGIQAGFTINQEQVERLTKRFRTLEVGKQYEIDGKKHHRSSKDSFTGRFFSLDKVFETLYDDAELETMELQEFYQIDTFSGYRQLMGSDLNLEKPRAITRFERKKRRWRKMFQQ
jgi:hypothetical protein